MSGAGKRIIAGLKQARAAVRGDLDAINDLRVTRSCGCVFCDLKLEATNGFHNVQHKGETKSILCPLAEETECLTPSQSIWRGFA